MNELSVILAALLLFGLWWLYFIEYRRYRVDLTRQRLFQIRDNLLAQIAAGALPADAKAYWMTRKMLNGMLQFTHRLSIIQLVAIYVAESKVHHGRDVRRFTRELDEAIRLLSPDGQAAVKNARTRMHITVIEHIVFNSIMLTSLYFVFGIAVRQFMFWRSIRNMVLHGKRWRNRWSAIDIEVTKSIRDDNVIAV